MQRAVGIDMYIFPLMVDRKSPAQKAVSIECGSLLITVFMHKQAKEYSPEATQTDLLPRSYRGLTVVTVA